MTKPKNPADKKKPGAKPHKPTDIIRGEVRGLAWANYPKEVIAKQVGLSEKTLTKHYSAEVERGRIGLVGRAAAQVSRFIDGVPAEYDDQHNLIRAEIKPEQASCFFVLKTQGKKLGWSERTELTGADGAPLFNDLDLSKLDAKEFAQLETLLRKCGVGIAA